MVVCDIRTEKTKAAINEIAIANDMGNIPDVPFDNLSDLDLKMTSPEVMKNIAFYLIICANGGSL